VPTKIYTKTILPALAVLLLNGCSVAALMNEQTLNQRLEAMDTRLRALEVGKPAVTTP
jgi:uncharacterized lipoprotein